MQYVSLPRRQLNCGSKFLDLSQPHVMGILNVTPDSFSDGGLHNSKQQAVDYAIQMIADGATVIDIGGESTRPGAAEVTVEEELARVIPVVEALSDQDVILSIDTSQPEVMRQAVHAGAHIWNDVRALTRPKALETAAELQVPVILMHMRGEPTTMNQLANYEHVTLEVITELRQKIDLAQQAGIAAENILIDPGFGFAKTIDQNFELLRHLDIFKNLDLPILAGVSRKSMIHKTLQIKPEEALNGTTVLNTLALEKGAAILRVHDVKEAVETIKLWQKVSI